jgi:hypothetical protein
MASPSVGKRKLIFEWCSRGYPPALLGFSPTPTEIVVVRVNEADKGALVMHYSILTKQGGRSTQRLMLPREGFKIFAIQWFGVTFVGSHR